MSYSPIQDPSFVGTDNWTDDENCEYELAGFHLLTECESRKIALCDWLYEEPAEDEVGESEDLIPEEPAEDEEEDPVERALALANFFARQRENTSPDRTDQGPPAELPGPELVERLTIFRRGYTWARKSRGGHIRQKFHQETFYMIGEWYVPGQQTHGGNDTRRRRRDGKILGGSHRRQNIFEDHTVDIQPVAVILPDGRRICIN